MDLEVMVFSPLEISGKISACENTGTSERPSTRCAGPNTTGSPERTKRSSGGSGTRSSPGGRISPSRGAGRRRSGSPPPSGFRRLTRSRSRSITCGGYRREGWARRFFDNWKESLKWQRLEPFETFAAIVERNWSGIAAYCEAGEKFSLGFVEGSTRRSGSSRGGRSHSRTKNTFVGRSSLACCPRSGMVTFHPLDYAMSQKQWSSCSLRLFQRMLPTTSFIAILQN